MDYGIIKIGKNTKNVPADAPIENLKFAATRPWTPYSKDVSKKLVWQNYDYRALTIKTRRALTANDIVTVQDLKGLSVARLQKLGMSLGQAQRLAKAAKLSSTDFRGDGFPWTVNGISFDVPIEFVETVSGAKKAEVAKAIQNSLPDDFWQNLESQVRGAKIAALKAKRAKLEQQITALQA